MDQGAEVTSDPTRATSARVIVNDLGRGAVAPEGLDYDSIARANPLVIYCSLVSFPEGGPEGVMDLEDEPVLSALGLNRYGWDAPRREPLPVPSFFGAVFAMIHIACALRPHINGRGPQHIEVPLFSAALNVLGRATVTVQDPRYGDAPPGVPRVPIAELYRCADGKYLQPHATFPHFAHIICAVGGHPEWGEEAAAGLRKIKDKETQTVWERRFIEMWRQKPARDWEDLLEAHHGAGTIARTHEEWRAEPHARASKIFVEDKKDGRWRLGPAAMLKANPRPADWKALETGSLPSSARGPLGKPLPLADIRVADFCIIIAGPTVGRLLSDLGADVVKVEAPNRDLSPYLWFDVNRGKRSIVLDMRKKSAHQVAQRIIDSADVVTENFRSGKFAALGFNQDELVASRPELIYGATNALDFDGPWETRAGWEHNAQAGSGQQMARAENGVAQQVPFPVNDYATGLCGAMGIVLAILRRDLTGLGSRTRASLVRSGTFLQFVSYEPDMDAPRRLRPGEFLKCQDGYVSAWLHVGATEVQERALKEARAGSNEKLCAAVLTGLFDAGVSAIRERKPKEMLREPWVAANGLAIAWEHPRFGPMHQATPRARASHFETSKSRPAPAPGAESLEILHELGFGARADQLLADGAVGAYMPLFGGD